MHERPTDNDRRKAAQEVHSPSKAGHFEGMGFNGKRGGGIPALWDSSYDPLSLEEAIGAGGRGISQGNPSQTEPPSQRVAERESEPIISGVGVSPLISKSSPKISVIIATYNRRKSLERVIENIFQNGYDNLEVIVVDGASTDGTVAFLQNYKRANFSWISEPDKGEFDANNKGLQMATGSILKFMQDDDLLRPGALELAANYFEQHPDVQILFGRCVYWDVSTGKKVKITETPIIKSERLALRSWVRCQQGVSNLGHFIRRTVFDLIGPFDPNYVAADGEFYCRAASRNIKMGFVQDIVADYFITGQNQSIVKVARMADDCIEIAKKYGDILAVFRVTLLRRCAGRLIPWFHRKGLHPVRFIKRIKILINDKKI